MKGILKFILFLEIVLLCSCVNDEKRSGAFGGMSLHLSANSSVTDVTTRSSEEYCLPYKISLFLCCKVTKCRLPGIS